jgi:Zn-finger nucleic acid-binding protein
MNCRNCGAAMELYATRGYFFCRYCGSFDFPPTTGADGVRVLGDDSEAKPCAVCGKTLATALLDETHPVRYCQNCRGVLIARSGFATVVQKRRAWATDQPGPAIPLDPSHLERQVSCPMCGHRMETHPYFGPGNVVIDSCVRCELVWLDFGELKQIVAAPGRDRGTREQVLRASADTPVTHLGVDARDGSDDIIDVLHILARLF